MGIYFFHEYDRYNTMNEKQSLPWQLTKYITKATVSIGSVGLGAVKGTSEFLYNTTSLFWYDKEKLNKLEQKITDQSERYGKVIENKSTKIDSGIIAGVVLTDYFASPESVPEGVELAYQAAYPNLAETMNFSEAAQVYDNPEAVNGFLAGVKGKLFERQYVDYLNNGNLPDGYTAELAQPVNQPGWDIRIVGPDESLTDMLQLKATDSVNYVIESARRYPDIDIVTTDEVYSQLLLHSNMENVDIINSGITEDSLVDLIETSTDLDYGVSDFLDMKIPIASLALIALSAYTEEQKDIYQKSFNFGDRSSKTVIAIGVGGFLTGFTTWWVGLIGAVGTRFVADRGRIRKLQHKNLKHIVDNNERAIKRYAYL